MPGSKYRFNPDTVNYEKINLGFKKILFRLLLRLGGSLIVAFVIIIGLSFIIDLPKDRVLKRENQQLRLQYEKITRKLNQIDDVLLNIQNRDDNLYRTIFKADPVPPGFRQAGFGGTNRYADLTGYECSNLIIETSKRLDIILNRMTIQKQSYDEILAMTRDNIKMLKCIPSILPVKITNKWTIRSGFTLRRLHPIYHTIRPHWGQDFHGAIGTPIYSTGDGTVIKIKNRPYAKVDFGTVIYIDHGYGYVTVYAHLDKVHVKIGQKITRGQIIADMGNTGGSVGPHLHYEVHLYDKKIDPANFFFADISATEFDRIISMSKDLQAFD